MKVNEKVWRCCQHNIEETTMLLLISFTVITCNELSPLFYLLQIQSKCWDCFVWADKHSGRLTRLNFGLVYGVLSVRGKCPLADTS